MRGDLQVSDRALLEYTYYYYIVEWSGGGGGKSCKTVDPLGFGCAVVFPSVRPSVVGEDERE